MAAPIGARLTALLRERGMSQKELAEATNLTPAAVSRYINGERVPRAITIAALAKALGVKPADITGTADEQETDEAIRLIARNASSLTEAQRAELIAALAKR
ncbi:helix-turn-helix transcriptional regulator [Paratractidigestivibacter sp.]|uniref:helix-turn-helix domain-containing protein n=1 Tax=Paratractidigestivibacter sp. TaxID=2847316 RepID=UPI002ABE5D85|nr:helix-turn-helix transcriptional regulator [Paratractidigestivibacter sp.]